MSQTRKPTTVSFEEAASLPCVGLTAYQSLVETLDPAPGESVAIAGAAGGVGSVALQLAVAREARVVATTSARNNEYLLGLGAGGTPSRATLEALADEIDSGRVRPSVQHVYRLDEAAEAQVRVAEGHVRGKLVISVGAVTGGASRVSRDQRTRAGATRAGS